MSTCTGQLARGAHLAIIIHVYISVCFSKHIYISIIKTLKRKSEAGTQSCACAAAPLAVNNAQVPFPADLQHPSAQEIIASTA